MSTIYLYTIDGSQAVISSETEAFDLDEMLVSSVNRGKVNAFFGQDAKALAEGDTGDWGVDRLAPSEELRGSEGFSHVTIDDIRESDDWTVFATYRDGVTTLHGALPGIAAIYVGLDMPTYESKAPWPWRQDLRQWLDTPGHVLARHVSMDDFIDEVQS